MSRMKNTAYVSIVAMRVCVKCMQSAVSSRALSAAQRVRFISCIASR